MTSVHCKKWGCPIHTLGSSTITVIKACLLKSELPRGVVEHLIFFFFLQCIYVWMPITRLDSTDKAHAGQQRVDCMDTCRVRTATGTGQDCMDTCRVRTAAGTGQDCMDTCRVRTAAGTGQDCMDTCRVRTAIDTDQDCTLWAGNDDVIGKKKKLLTTITTLHTVVLP